MVGISHCACVSGGFLWIWPLKLGQGAHPLIRPKLFSCPGLPCLRTYRALSRVTACWGKGLKLKGTQLCKSRRDLPNNGSE